MRVGVREEIEVRLSDAEISIPELIQGMRGSGGLGIHNLAIVETMAVDLYSPDGSFYIEHRSDRE
jgi:hypothetical protein